MCIRDRGRHRVRWVPARVVVGVPYDTPILGYHVNTANTLRLWRAEAAESFDFSTFNRGDYWGAVNQKVTSENITKVLYPNDDQLRGKELRLEQQYFFVCASLQDMLRIIQVQKIAPERFHEKFAIQLNDTHPSIAVAELMRLLIDELALDWESAWAITRRTFAYTNHCLLYTSGREATGSAEMQAAAIHADQTESEIAARRARGDGGLLLQCYFPRAPIAAGTDQLHPG